ncbi:uncharacterized protein CHSO_3684 [Chryseobacterium sp. StRB126]|uniref:hypothetical protein n=1 Tax=Chryseobacterium sp. StRB126 TaxID=878220 RepID=UPI0004E990D3|nr:hypothetical protein [Chryseobacterium sp. StRB126]BAP32721.1 uncharacterized protein CHSO_3684 [Chryseobacterium sp. StRB126]
MRKDLLLGTLLFPLLVYAQVGMNIPMPAATLDVTAKNATGTTSNVDGLLIPRVDRERAQSMTSVPTSTLIYVNSIATGTQTGTAASIDAIGYYYFDGTAWAKLNMPVNIYTSNGTLAGNRIVTTAGNTLRFVNGANDVIIGTSGVQGIVLATGSTRGAFQATGGTGVLNMFVDNASTAQITTSGSSTGMSLNTISANPINLLTNNTNRMTVTGAGDVGIRTTTPQKNLHVNGTLQVTNEINVGGNATTAGSAGTLGQILTSGGAGAAPSWQTLNTISGTINSAVYVQGTTEASATQGTTIDVPGVTYTVTVPAGRTQTLLFTILGYATNFPSGGVSSQGVFSLIQDGVKVSSAYTTKIGAGGGLNDLPTPVTFLKSITLTSGTYVFKVQYSAWSGLAKVNVNPTTYSGYNLDPECMLTKMQILVYNN